MVVLLISGSTRAGSTGAVVVGPACRRVPLTRADVGDDGLVHDPGARAEALAALRALEEQGSRRNPAPR